MGVRGSMAHDELHRPAQRETLLKRAAGLALSGRMASAGRCGIGVESAGPPTQ